MTLKVNYTVIGAGCGGQALAGYLAFAGFDVKVYNRSSDRIESFQDRGYIDLVGAIEGRGQLSYIGTDISKALIDSDIIMVVITADGHKEIAEKMAPYLRNGQMIILNPGRTCGALEFDYVLGQSGCTADVVVAEANTLVFTTRVLTPGVATIKGIKQEVAVSALHSEDTAIVIDNIHPAFPQFVPATSFLETSFGNIGAIFHPLITLFNKERIIAKESFDFYTDGVTKEVVDHMEQIDNEIQDLARAMGTKVLSIRDWLQSRYCLEMADIHTMLRENPTYRGIKAPRTLDNRYLWEDIPTGLVPISSFGDALGVNTSSIDLLIDEGGEVLDRNFWEVGRTPEKMGLSKEHLLPDLERIMSKSSHAA